MVGARMQPPSRRAAPMRAVLAGVFFLLRLQLFLPFLVGLLVSGCREAAASKQ